MSILWRCWTHCKSLSQYWQVKANACDWAQHIFQHWQGLRNRIVSEISHSQRLSQKVTISAYSLMKESLKGNHLILSCTLFNDNDTINSYSMIDCDASEKAFIDFFFVQFHKIPLLLLHQPCTVTVVNGCVISSEVITHFVRVSLVIDNHIEITDMFIIKLSHYLVILGIPWLQSHDPHIYWKVNTLTFNSSHCLSHCLTASRSTIVHGLSVISEFLLPYACLSARVLLSSLLDVKISESSPQIILFNAHCSAKVPLSISLDAKIHKGSPQTTLDVAAIEAAPFNLWVKHHLIKVFIISLRDIEKALESKKHFNPAVKLLKEYHQFLDVFSRQEADTLSIH